VGRGGGLGWCLLTVLQEEERAARARDWSSGNRSQQVWQQLSLPGVGPPPLSECSANSDGNPTTALAMAGHHMVAALTMGPAWSPAPSSSRGESKMVLVAGMEVRNGWSPVWLFVGFCEDMFAPANLGAAV
jgi:hypothetical protein